MLRVRIRHPRPCAFDSTATLRSGQPGDAAQGRVLAGQYRTPYGAVSQAALAAQGRVLAGQYRTPYGAGSQAALAAQGRVLAGQYRDPTGAVSQTALEAQGRVLAGQYRDPTGAVRPDLSTMLGVSDALETTALAYLITFRCYGTWLHGDYRGSTMRYRSTYDTPPHVERRAGLEAMERATLKSAPFDLNALRRAAVRAGIEHECPKHRWTLHVLNVRTNHVHVVLSASLPPERVMTMLKSAGTRGMREAGLMRADERAWSRHGSTVYLWTEAEVESACTYVVPGQGAALE